MRVFLHQLLALAGLVVILCVAFRFGIVSFGNKFTEVNHGNKEKED